MAWTRNVVGFVVITSCVACGGAIAACGGSTTSGSHATDGGADSTGDEITNVTEAAADVTDAGVDVGYPAAHYAVPQVVNLAGGPVLKTPKLYLAFYPGYSYESDLQAMAQGLGSTSYWAAITNDYGVGPIQLAQVVDLTGQTPPTSVQDSDIQTFLGDMISSGAFGAPDPEGIYTIFYPTTTTITLPSGGPFGSATSCVSFGGYHSDFTLTIDGGQPQDYAYAVIPTCSGLAGLTEEESVTGAVSHEWIEASTDPYPSTNQGINSAYAQVDDNHFVFELVGGGGEVGDMCIGEQVPFISLNDGGIPVVQRIWSNSFATAGHDPCVPNLDGVTYFQSAPKLDQTINFSSGFTGSIQTQGVTIPVGQSKTIEVDLFSDGPTTGPWTVSTTDFLAEYTQSAPTLKFAWDKTHGTNGDKLNLTITVLTAEPEFGGGHPFIITSTLGVRTTSWAGLVVE